MAIARHRKKARRSEVTFAWKQTNYVLNKVLHDGVVLYVHKDTRQEVVRKVISLSTNERELQILKTLPKCNHVVSLLAYEMHQPSPQQASLFFQWYPLGDVHDWKESFKDRNNKQVPETFIWRLFIQMSQALAFIHKGYGTNARDWTPLIHRDIKPENIMVAMVGTYPSFKLNDFGVSKLMNPGSHLDSTCGTYIWQPPELPRINTTAADIWSLGAVVHYLATGRAPTESVMAFRAKVLEENDGKHPESCNQTEHKTNYYRHRVPRKVTPINVTYEEQRAAAGVHVHARYLKHVYSDELNRWMMKALQRNAAKRATTDQLLKNMISLGKTLIKKMSGTSGLAELDMVVEETEEDDEDEKREGKHNEKKQRDVPKQGSAFEPKGKKNVRGKKRLG
jgi:serine/threonine protein kinase